MSTLAYNSASSRAIALPIFSREKIFWTCTGGIVAMSLLYLYFIGGTVLQVVERKNIELEIRTRSAEVAALESEYVELGRELSLPAAQALGYREMKDITHVSRMPSFTMRSE